MATNEKHQQLVGVLNQHLQCLARDIEDVVGAALNLQLEPISMELDPPSLEQFHHSIQELFQKGTSIGAGCQSLKLASRLSTCYTARFTMYLSSLTPVLLPILLLLGKESL